MFTHTRRRTSIFLASVLLVSVSMASVSTASAQEAGEFDASGWNALLTQFVTADGVNYAAWKQHGTKELDAFLAAAAEYDMTATLAKEPRAAFLINAYNAFAVRQILEHYPVASVKDIPGFLDENVRHVAQADRTLNDLESMLMSMMKQSPAACFAICPGAQGMPPLRPTAYVSKTLDADLRAQAGLYFSGVGQIRLDRETKILHLPPQFETYAEIFDGQERGLAGFLSDYLSLSDVVEVGTGAATTQVSEVSWLLNDSHPPKTMEAPADGQ